MNRKLLVITYVTLLALLVGVSAADARSPITARSAPDSPGIAAAAAALQLDQDIDLTAIQGGLVLQSQMDPRWNLFGVGPRPTNEVTLGRCGCFLAALSTILTYYLGEPSTSTSAPWFTHLQRNVTNMRFEPVLSWSPAYLDGYLSQGPRPNTAPRSFGWGYNGGGGGTCGFSVYPWALTDVADPIRDPITGAPLTKTGVSVNIIQGFGAEARQVVDANLRQYRPTIVVVSNGSGGYHAQIIAGWDQAFQGYMIVDPAWPTGSPARIAAAAGNSARERYDNWLGSIVDVRDVRPVYRPSWWLLLLDDPEPIEILSINPLGRRTGFDPATGVMIREDPSVSYERFTSWTDPLGALPADDLHKYLTIQEPMDGVYRFEVVGTGDGPFTLRFATVAAGEQTIIETVTGVITNGQVLKYEVAYSSLGASTVVQVPTFTPEARAGSDVGGAVGASLTFDGSQSFDLDGAIASYAWDFGDGATGAGSIVSHAYDAPGVYAVTLEVTDDMGARDTHSIQAVVGYLPGPRTEVVSISSAAVLGNLDSESPALSANGRFVAFGSTANNLVSGDTNARQDIFVRDRALGLTERVSLSSAGAQADNASYSPAISADGRFVAFVSEATNLAPGDMNGSFDIFVRDRVLGATERVSVSSADAQADGYSYNPAISADGRFVAFFSEAANLAPGDTNNVTDVFVRDRTLGITERVSVSGAGQQGNDHSSFAATPSLSEDGRYVGFFSYATNLVPGDTNGRPDAFVRDRTLGITERVSVSSTGEQGDGLSGPPAISANGRFVAFFSGSQNLVPGALPGGGGLFVRDLQTDQTLFLSRVGQGTPSLDDLRPAISADGRYVAFWSDDVLADDGFSLEPLLPNDANGYADIFVFDRQTAGLELLSLSAAGAPANAPTSSPAISADGRLVAFGEPAWFITPYLTSLAPNDTNQSRDVYVRAVQPNPPIANLSGPHIGWANSPEHPAFVAFNGNGSLGSGLTATWDFGDGSPPQTTSTLSVSHAFAAPGLYTVTLTVSDGSAVSQPAVTTVEVFPPLPADGLVVAPACGTVNTELSLGGFAASYNAGLLDGGWDLSAGPLLLNEIPVSLPWGGTIWLSPSLPSLSVQTTVTVPAGVTAGQHLISIPNGPTATLTIPCPPPDNQPPLADAGGPFYAGRVGGAVTLDGSGSSDPEGEPLSYAWDFGDGAAGTGVNPAHQYRAEGTYLVTLVVNDGQRASSSAVGTRSFALVTISGADLFLPLVVSSGAP